MEDDATPLANASGDGDFFSELRHPSLTPFSHVHGLGPCRLGGTGSGLHLLAESVDMRFDDGLVPTKFGIREALGQDPPSTPVLLLVHRRRTFGARWSMAL